MLTRIAILTPFLLFASTILGQKTAPPQYKLEIKVVPKVLVDKVLVHYTTKSSKEKKDSALTKSNSVLFHLSSFKPGESELEIVFRGRLSGKTFSRNIGFFLAAEDMVVYINESFEVDSLRGPTITAFSKVREEITLMDKKAKEYRMSLLKKNGMFSDPPDSIRKKFDSIYILNHREKTKLYLDFVTSNASSPFALFILKEIGSSYSDFPEEFEAAMASLPQSVRSTEEFKKITTSINVVRATSVGQIAPSFTQADTSGRLVKLSSFRGKYVLIDFWASWCGPCRQESPFLVKAYKQFSSKNFTIISVSLDDKMGKKKWIDAIHKDELTWTNLSDLASWNNKAAVLYGIESIPANFLLDPTGKIVARNLRGTELLEELEKILK